MTTVAPTNLAPPAGLVPGLDALGAYHLLRPIGAGGMARVWLAVDARTGRKVAVKRMLPQVRFDEELRQMFADEATLGVRLRHPNIVETIELAEAVTATGNEKYIVLELLQGRPLIEVLRGAGRHKADMPLAVIVHVVVAAARALEHAHSLVGEDGRSLGVVHRDVTPHNVFVCEDGTVKLVDFGIAKTSDQSHKTRTGLVKGKLAYLAPEQIKGRDLDARADVFALGIVLWELLTGRPLFRGSNDAETLHRVLTLEVEAPDALRSDVPNGLGAIALRALQRDRERRLPSAGAFADAIEAVAEAASIGASQADVKAFVDAIFPDDADEHAEDRALAQRTYEHLTSSQLRALDSNPWITPAEGVPPVAPRRPVALLAFLAIAIVTVAALVTMRLLAHPRVARVIDKPRSAPVELPAPPVLALPTPAEAAPVVAVPLVTMPVPAPVNATSRRARGSLRITATPWAGVTLDGKAVGTTPLHLQQLTPGSHTVVLTNPYLRVRVERRVVIKGGQEAEMGTNLSLQKKSATDTRTHSLTDGDF